MLLKLNQTFSSGGLFSVPLRHGAVYQLGMHSLVPGKLEIMALPHPRECQAFVQDERDISWVEISLAGLLSTHNFPR